MTEKTVKGLPPLCPDTEQPYDDLINQIREELGVPFNRSILAKIAVEEYVTSKKGNIKAIAAPYARIKIMADIESMKVKAAEKQKQLEALK